MSIRGTGLEPGGQRFSRDEITTPARPGRPVLRAAKAAVVVLTVAVLMSWVLPRLAGASWGVVLEALRAVPLAWLTGLALIWAGGLAVNSFVLTGALPGLTVRRALTLSLTGSAIANLLPVGGAAGVALNYHMARSWGFSRRAIATFTVVTNIWDIAAKLILPVLLVPALIWGGDTAYATWHLRSLIPIGVLAVLLGAAGIIGANARATNWFATRLDRSMTAAFGFVRRPREIRWGHHLVNLRADCAGVVRQRWLQMTLAVVAYTASLALLLWGCCQVAGVGLPPHAVLVGFVGERLLTMAGLTPGGAGIVEVGLSGLLIAGGGVPLAVVTAVLLYRLFTYGLEIPVGGLGVAAWQSQRRRHLVGTA